MEALRKSLGAISKRLGATPVDLSYHDETVEHDLTHQNSTKRVEFVVPPLAVQWGGDDAVFVNPQGIEQRACTM